MEMELAAACAEPPLALTEAPAWAAAEAKLCCTALALEEALFPPQALLRASA